MGVGIQVENLNAWFGKTQALRNINMTAEANHATAIIGPSGCGKSTFVRCLNRMHETVPEAHATGRVRIGDLDVYNRTSAVAIRRRIGMVFQKPNPCPTMSIYDNVALGLKLNGFREHKRLDDIVERSLKLSALWEEVKDNLKKKSGARLSGGQQQRLCIARALAVQPEVLLMDEPCSALDPISTGKIEELILQLKESFTIVIVTHNMQQASRVAEFTGFFLLGQLIEFDKTEKIFTTPSDKRTGDYITEAAYGRGGSRWRTTLSITLCTATSGVITGVMLAFARIAGETALLLFTAFGNQFWNWKLNQPTAALSLQIFNYAISPFDEWHRQAWAGALILIVLIVASVSAVRLAASRGALKGAN